MKIAVVGSGYVGLVAAASFAEIGHQVICADNDIRKIAALQSGIVPIHEKFLPEIISRHCGERLTFTTSTQEAVRASDVVFIAVGTPPTEAGAADLSHVECVARDIARAINGFKLVVEKSTVPVYTNEWVHRAMLLNGAPEGQFEVVSNPEFLREGTAVTDFLYPDRVVVGCSSERAARMMREIYAPVIDGTYASEPTAIPRPEESLLVPQFIQTSARSAELIKHASNAFLAMRISFINAVANVCELVGADIEEVARGMGSDTRIGSRFLRAGLGYGGSCFPKDVSAFKTVAQECGYEFRLLDEVIRINDDQRQAFLRKVRTALWTLKGKRLAVLGLSFKGDTDDIRESPAVAIVKALLAQECSIVAYDPAAMERAKAELPCENISYAEGPYEAMHQADALLILTDWEEFASLDLARAKSLLRYPIVLDGRNLYEPEVMACHGLSYYSVGRTAVISKPAADPVRQVSVQKNGNGIHAISPNGNGRNGHAVHTNGHNGNGHHNGNRHNGNGHLSTVAKVMKASANGGASANGPSHAIPKNGNHTRK